MRPGQLEQQEANIAGTEASTAGTEASTAGTLGREGRAVELRPGAVEKQQLDIEGAGISNKLAQGNLDFQPTAQDIQRQQAVLSAAGAGVGMTPEGGLVPGDVDARVAQQQQAAGTRDEYMQAMIDQIHHTMTQKGYTGLSASAIRGAIQQAMSEGFGTYTDMNKHGAADIVFQKAMKILEMQMRINQELQTQGVIQ
jgi:hypothetical protein